MKALLEEESQKMPVEEEIENEVLILFFFQIFPNLS